MQDEPASTNTSRDHLASPKYVDLCRAQAKALSILAACCTLVATSYSESILTFLNQFASIYSFSFLVMLFALVLPGRLFLLSIPLTVAALDALDRVNQLKISALSLPITFVDVKTIITDPGVLVNAVGIRDEVDRIVAIAFGVLALMLLASAFYKRQGYSFLDHLKLSRSSGDARTRSSSFVLNVIAFVVVLNAAQTCLVRYGRFVHAHLTTKATNLGLELWLPSSQVILSQELGVLEYMAFSFAANDAPEISLEHGLGPTFQELRLAAAKFVNSAVPRPKRSCPTSYFFMQNRPSIRPTLSDYPRVSSCLYGPNKARRGHSARCA